MTDQTSDQKSREAIADVYEVLTAAAIKDRRMCRVRWTSTEGPGHQLVAAEALASFLDGITMRASLEGSIAVEDVKGPDGDLALKASDLSEPIEGLNQTADVRFMDEHYWIGDCPKPEQWGEPIITWTMNGPTLPAIGVEGTIRSAKATGRLMRIDYVAERGATKGGMEVRPADIGMVMESYREMVGFTRQPVTVTLYRRKA